MSRIKLHELIKEAHTNGARRGCLSTQVLVSSFQGNGGDGWKSINAAMNSMGGPHAPILKTFYFLCKLKQDRGNINNIISHSLNGGLKIPGFGCSFVKGKRDPMLDDLKVYLFQEFPEINNIITEVEIEVLKHKPIYPNLAIYTAAYAMIIDWPIPLMDSLLLRLRLDAWEQILIEQDNKTKLSDQ